MNAIYTKDYQNKKIVPILKEYSAKKYGRKREFVDAEMSARLGQGVEEEKLPEAAVVPVPPAPAEAAPTVVPTPAPVEVIPVPTETTPPPTT
jgi:hypothetical protein